jgi:hypothetical protein
MRAIITVFEDEFKGKESVFKNIQRMSIEVNFVTHAYIIIPKRGELFNVLNVLKNEKVAYGTHFDTSDES